MEGGMIDSHTHIYLDQFDHDREDIIMRCKAKKIEALYMPNIDVQTIPLVKSSATQFPGYCIPMMGLHPCSVKDNFEIELDRISVELRSGSYAAIGETGIDLYWDKSLKREQILAFQEQLSWARDLDLPIIIHSRESLDLILDILESGSLPARGGIFHCFTGGIVQANRIVDLGFLMGIGGVITFKNSGMTEVLRNLSLESIVLETDAPYLAPTPHRGKRNEPSYLPLIGQKLAEIKNVSIDEVAHVTTQNAKGIFSKG